MIMTPRIVEAKYKSGYTIWVRFEDGVSGDIDLQNELWGEVFEPLKQMSEFKKFRVDEELQTLVWPNGADFAPEYLYSRLQPGHTLGKPTKRGIG
jgi:hypothetical protein